MLARTCTDSYVRSRADLQRLNYVDVQSSVAVRDSRQDQRRLTTSPFQSRRPPISTRRATTARRPLAGDSSGFQQTVQLTRQLCDPAAGSSPRPTCLDSHFTHLTGGMAVTRWGEMTDGAPPRRLDAKKTRNSFGSFIIRRPFAGIPGPMSRPWSVFSAERGVCLGSFHVGKTTMRLYEQRHRLTNTFVARSCFPFWATGTQRHGKVVRSVKRRYQSIAGARATVPCRRIYGAFSCAVRPTSEGLDLQTRDAVY